MGDGDGFIFCAAGHRHWGRHGAAGLLLTGPGQVVLQHRSIHTHEGGTWALPGGARDSHEDAVQTALREAGEEAGLHPADVVPVALARAEHIGWSYTTVVASARGDVRPFAANWESDEVRWWPAAEVDGLALHAGFATAWPLLKVPPKRLRLVVDAANVVGSRADGWWRDRPAATARLRTALLGLARAGIKAEELPESYAAGAVTAYLPQITLVVEGAARTVVAEGPTAQAPDAIWWLDAVELVASNGSGDDEVVAQAQATEAPVVVITADRGLRERLGPTVTTRGPSWLWRQIDGADPHY